MIDAAGKYVLPGCIDPHTHLDMPFGGTTTIDDVESGQTSAAFGGTTCHVDFIIQGKGQTFAQALEDWRAKANGKQVIDMGYHMAVTDLAEGGTLEELATLPDQGITSYKLFMAYKGALMVDDETLFRTMEVAREDRRARDGARRERRRHRHPRPGGARRGAHGAALPRAHAAARGRGRGDEPGDPARASRRRAAVRRARVLQGVGRADRSRAREGLGRVGRDVHAVSSSRRSTTSPKPNFEGAKYVFSPPVRDKSNRDVLWNAVRTDALSAISTDHCAFRFDGQKTLGKDDFSKIPNGGPGLENRLQMIHEFGVRAGRISLNRMVELLATNPAKLFGLYPRKGTIAVGSDADIVVFDPEKKVTISAKTQHSKVDYNLYEGTEVTGSPEVVLLRGHVLVENDELVASPGVGQFVAARPLRRRAEAGARSSRVGAATRPRKRSKWSLYVR